MNVAAKDAVQHAIATSVAAASAPIATITLSDVNHIVSILVGLLSGLFILYQIIKLRRELRRVKETDHVV